MNNPYKPPASSIERRKKKLPDDSSTVENYNQEKMKPSKRWFVYNVILCVIGVLYWIGSGAMAVVVVDIYLTIKFAFIFVGLYGVFKFAKARAVKQNYARFWKLFPYAYLAVAVYELVLYDAFSLHFRGFIFDALFYGPQTYALFEYSNRFELEGDRVKAKRA